MKVIIANDLKVINPNQAVIDYCNNKLIIDNPDFIVAEKVGRYTGNIPRKMKLYVQNGDTYVLPFGTIKDIWKASRGFDYELKIHDFIGSNMQGCINLYDYQEKALKSLVLGKNGVLEAPCGSGKTQIGLQLIKSIGGRALWLTHTHKLLEQSKARCEMYFSGDFGTITEGQVRLGKDITFATVQTMCKIDPSIYRDEFDIVVVDECHHCVGSPTKVMQFYKILTNCNARYKYGLSATLNRSDNMMCSLFSIIGEVLYTIDKSDVGDKIIKAEHRKVDVLLDYNMMDYLDTDGTLNYTSLINTLSFDDRRNRIIIDKVFEEFNNGRKQLILCHRVKQVEELSKQISKFAKVNSITGKVNQKTRQYDGDVIIATYSLAKEGLDIPELNVLHLATPQKNASTTEQSVGRIERNISGKETPICYDYVDNSISYCVNCYKRRKSILKKK